jgi:hypothetical protein
MYTADALNWRFSSMTRKAGLGHWHALRGPDDQEVARPDSAGRAGGCHT